MPGGNYIAARTRECGFHSARTLGGQTLNLIIDPLNISSEWLTEILRDAGALNSGAVRRIDAQPSRSTPVSTVTRLTVDYGTSAPESAPTRLFLKTPKPDLPSFVSIQLGDREVRFYRDLAPAMLGSPLVRCYSAVFEAESGGWHVLLDDLTESHMTFKSPDPPTLAICKRAVESMAAVHAYWWEKDPPSSNPGDREQPDEPPAEQWEEQCRQLLDAFGSFLGDRLSEHRRATYLSVIEELPALRRWRNGKRPTTVVHGDAHLGNFLFPRASETGPVYPCDWQDWWIGEPTRDVAYLVGKYWDARLRADSEVTLVRHYHQRLESGGVKNYSWDDCWDDYRYSIVSQIFIPLGQWEIGLDEDIWWIHFNSGLDAFDDLRCAELFGR